ncbi:MAG: hypothetical protein QXI43_00015 [Candidatus Nitrosocaldus sp.]
MIDNKDSRMGEEDKGKEGVEGREEEEEEEEEEDNNSSITAEELFSNINMCEPSELSIIDGMDRIIYVFVPKGSKEEEIIDRYLVKAQVALYDKAKKMVVTEAAELVEKEKGKGKEKKGEEEEERLISLIERLDRSLVVLAPYEVDFKKCERQGIVAARGVVGVGVGEGVGEGGEGVRGGVGRESRGRGEEDRKKGKGIEEDCSCRRLRDTILLEAASSSAAEAVTTTSTTTKKEKEREREREKGEKTKASSSSPPITFIATIKKPPLSITREERGREEGGRREETGKRKKREKIKLLKIVPIDDNNNNGINEYSILDRLGKLLLEAVK